MASQLTAVLMLVVLASACATPRKVLLDTGQGEPLEYRPLTASRSVQVSQLGFEEALARLMLEKPLVVRPAGHGFLVSTVSAHSSGDISYWLGKALGGPCRPGQPRSECVSLLDDVMGLSPWEKLAVGLGLSLQPMRESIARALEDTLTPQLFAAAIGAGMVSWVLLAANPEPVFTKAAAVVAAVMVLYLGVDAFLAVVRACQELRRASEQAVTFEELEEASQRFGTQVGPQVARVFILAVTVVVSRGTMGGATWLAGRLPLLPSFAEASAVGAARVGIAPGQVGQVSAVAVVEGNLVISLAPTAVFMAAMSGKSEPGSGTSSRGAGFNSFEAFKDAMGSAGPDKNWHHIVEQTRGNIQRFGPQAIHNTDNLIVVDEAVHWQISGFYSSKRPFSQGMTVRQWLSTQSFEAQRAFGLKTLRDFGVIP
jgi:hypothetical protein